MASFATMRLENFELSDSAVKEIMQSDEVAAILNEYGASIEASLWAENRGEFRSFPSDRGNRRRNFVVTYDRHAKRTANVDPGIFSRFV
jgi:hypothetical protein